MVTTHILGHPRIDAQRELKFVPESSWKGISSEDDLRAVGRALREHHWTAQCKTGFGLVTMGDFAWYDQVLRTVALLGAIPTHYGFGAAQLTPA